MNFKPTLQNGWFEGLRYPFNKKSPLLYTGGFLTKVVPLGHQHFK